MTDKKQPEALRLADALERPGYGWHSTPAQCAAELRRQYAERETLRASHVQAPAPAAQGDELDVVLDAFENKTRGIPQAHIAAALVAELRAAIEAASTTPTAQVDALESEYQRGYRQGYEQRDAEVRGALV